MLLAPRRYGKTSLALKVLDELTKKRQPQVASASCDLLVAHDDTSVRDIVLDAVARLTVRCIPPHRRALQILGRFFSALKPEIVLSSDGVRVVFTPAREAPETISAALAGIDSLAADRGLRAVLVMDEFQSLAGLRASHSVEAAIRHVAQGAKRLSFVFSGSSRHMLSALFEDAARPLYHLCERLVLGRISAADYRPFVRRAARSRWEVNIDDGALKRIFVNTQRHPYYFNLLCARLWRGDKPPKSAHVDRTWQAYVDEQPNWLTREVGSLSPNQRAVLVALTITPTNKPQSKAFLSRTRLAGASNAQAIQVLMERDLIYRDPDGVLRVLDPALESYVRGAAPAGSES